MIHCVCSYITYFQCSQTPFLKSVQSVQNYLENGLRQELHSPFSAHFAGEETISKPENKSVQLYRLMWQGLNTGI